MAAIWQIRFKDTSGGLVAYIHAFMSFVARRVVNGVGLYSLRLSGDDPKCALFDLDGQIEFWRANDAYGIDWRLEFEGFHRAADWRLREDGTKVYESAGPDYNDLLMRRIIASAAASAGAEKDGLAETVIKGFVDEQCGPGAGARALAGLSIEADGATGNTVRLARPYRNVVAVCQEITRIGGGDYAVVGTGAATYEFRWYLGQLGTDRSLDVTFAPEWGNMGTPRLTIPRHQEISAVLVGGQGDGAARTTVWRTDAARIAESPWNRRELFLDQRQESDPNGLDSAGDRALEEGKARAELTFEVLQTPGCLYGRDYFLGDLVTARFEDYTATQKIDQVTFTVNKGGEKIAVETSDV